MIKGLYAAASAMLAGVDRQRILAHNAANLETPGFKQTLSSLDEFMTTPAIFSPNNVTQDWSQSVFDNIGLGVETTPEITDYTEGGLKSTGNQLDLALTGSGFFRIMTPNGERLTRDGRFLRDASGQLVTIDGYQVLNQNGQAIKLADGNVSIAQDGTISVGTTAAGKLGIVAYKDPRNELTRDDSNTFLANVTPTAQASTVQVQQGYLEMSNVNPSQLMTQMVAVARSYEAAQKMVQTQDELLGKTISTLGRLS